MDIEISLVIKDGKLHAIPKVPGTENLSGPSISAEEINYITLAQFFQSAVQQANSANEHKNPEPPKSPQQ